MVMVVDMCVCVCGWKGPSEIFEKIIKKDFPFLAFKYRCEAEIVFLRHFCAVVKRNYQMKHELSLKRDIVHEKKFLSVRLQWA